MHHIKVFHCIILTYILISSLTFHVSAAKTTTTSTIPMPPAQRTVYETSDPAGTTDIDQFEKSQDIYIKGTGWHCSNIPGKNKVYVYIVLEDGAPWVKGATKLSDKTLIKSFAEVKLNSDGTFADQVKWAGSETEIGKYDVFVECKNPGVAPVYDDSDVVDLDTDVMGFEVLPEPATIILLGLGIMSMVGYACARK